LSSKGKFIEDGMDLPLDEKEDLHKEIDDAKDRKRESKISKGLVE
jgi:hypothetical protein